MPNPRANRPLTLDQVTADLKSFAQPAQALFDMMAGALRGSAVATAGLPGDLETLGRMGLNAAGGAFNPAMPSRSGRAFQPVSEEPFFPSSEELAKRFAPTIPNGDPVRRKSAEPFEELGQFAPLPMSGKALKVLPYALGRGTGMATKEAARAINDAMVYQTGPLSKGPLSMLAPKGAVSHVIKPKGGNWIGGNVAGNVDRALNALKTDTVAGKTPIERIPMHEELLLNPELNDESRAVVQRHLDTTKGEAAVDQWIANNVGNYIKKDMATPTDPVRLMFERRAQEIEAQFQTDMSRAERTRARAEAETDPRRRANLMRQAAQQEDQAKFDRDFANEHITHLPKEDDGIDRDTWTNLRKNRREAGFDPEGVAQSDPAKRWEGISDDVIEVTPASRIQGQREKYLQLQSAEQAHANMWNQITGEYVDQFKKMVAERGASLTDDQIMRIAESTPIDEKARAIGKEDEFAKLRSNLFKARGNSSAGYLKIGEENPWIAKLDPESKVYSAYIGDLGIDHVVDVIRQDVAAGRIRPEQLSKLSMDQAIQRTSEFNMEQAKKMREAVIKNTEGFPIHKEYADEGYKWVELSTPKMPDVLPEGWSEPVQKGNALQTVSPEGKIVLGFNLPDLVKNIYRRHPETPGNPEKALEDALKYEGDTMGHCVGNYCPDVIEGKTRIYSLRDKRGEPHVTVEVKPNEHLDYNKWFDKQPEEVQNRIAKRRLDDKNHNIYEGPEYLADRAALSPKITQIKGKGNAKPKEEYIPFVQDFVRGGEWSDVGDFKNTGLVKYEGKIMTQAEADDLLYQQLNKDTPGITNELGLTTPPAPPADGMKHGGSVHISDNPDTMMMELGDKHFQVGGIVDAAARTAKAAKAAQMKKAMKASEALAQIEGKNLNITQADRTKVGEGLLGGPGFSGLQLQEGPHKQAGAVWGVKNPGTAKTMLGGFKDPLGKEYFTTMIGSPTQHQSNQMVFDKLYGKFKSEAKRGNLDPELQQKINERLANAVDKDGNPVFPPDVDILSKDFKKIANTFDRRSIAGNLIGGVGVGGRKGQIIDYDKIIRDTTDPFLLDMPSGSLGHRLWTPSGEIIERPDLHPAFPAIATGEDLGVEFTPAAQDILMAPWIENVRQTKGRNPGYMDWTRGRPPSVQVSDEILRRLEESGNKEGGAITVKPKRDGQKFKPGRKPDQILKHGQAMPRGKDPEVDIGQMVPHMSAGGKLSKVALEAIQRMKAMRPEIAAKSSLEQKALMENTAKYARDIQPFTMTEEEVAAEIKRLESKGLAGGGAINADDLILEERRL